MATQECLKRSPRPNTKYFKVFDAYQPGISRKCLSEETGLTIEEVKNTLINLRRDGYLPHPTQAEKMRAVSEAKGGIGIVIQPYAELKMAPKEIQIVLNNILSGNKFSLKQIADALRNGRKWNRFPKLTPEEMHDIRLDNRVADEELQQRVSAWCELKKVFEDNNLPIPQGRIEWKKAIVEYHRLIKRISGWADREDQKGLYFLKDGRKCRRTILDENGNLVFDTFIRAKQRWETRQRNGINHK